MDPKLGIADLKKSADELMKAAYNYWEMCHKTGLVTGAVVFFTDDKGQMVVFTRGEYRSTIMQNIDRLGLGEPIMFGAFPE